MTREDSPSRLTDVLEPLHSNEILDNLFHGRYEGWIERLNQLGGYKSIIISMAGVRVTGERLAGLQAARCVAALLVVVYHATRSVSLPQYLGYIPFANAFGFGHAGVDFFFVLSGFIITHAHVTDVGQPDRLCRYLWRRVTRIYPIYWFVTVLEMGHAAFAPDASIRLAPIHLLNSLLLLPADTYPLVSVAWTLQSEMLFYLVFGLAIINRRFCKPLIVCTLLLALGGHAAPPGPWVDLLVSPYNIEFIMGISVARLLSYRRIPFPVSVVSVGIALFLAVGAAELHGFVPINGLMGRFLYGGASVIILSGLVEAERSGRLHFGAKYAMLGDVSYCLYLIHLAIIPITVRLGAYFGVLTALPSAVLILALTALSLAVAITVHKRVELPLMAYIRRWTPRKFR